MSMPSIVLQCDKCDYAITDMVLWGHFSYQLDEREISIDRQLGWCHQCEALKSIERFDPDKYLARIRECQEELSQLQSSPFTLFISKSQRQKVSYYQEDIEKQAMALYIASKRMGTEKCLECGSDNVEPFNGDYSLECGGELYQGEKHTGFHHPGCGGEFIATPNPVRYNMALVHRVYDINGIKLHEDRTHGRIPKL